MVDCKEVIKRKRKEKGLSQNQLAKLVEISQPHMNQIESGVRKPSLAVMMRICEVLEIPLFGEDVSHE